MADSVSFSTKNWTIYRIVAVLLIMSFLWRVLVAAHEYPSRTSQILTLVVDAMLLFSLVSLRSQWAKLFDRNDPRRGTGNLFFGLGLTAGIGLFLIRLTSDSAWWTGHFFYSLD